MSILTSVYFRIQANAVITLTSRSWHCMLLMQLSWFKLIKMKPLAVEATKLSFHLTKPLSHATTSINCGFLSYSLPKVNLMNTNIPFPSTPRLVGVTHVLDNMHAQNLRKGNWQHGLSSDFRSLTLQCVKWMYVYLFVYTRGITKLIMQWGNGNV